MGHLHALMEGKSIARGAWLPAHFCVHTTPHQAIWHASGVREGHDSCGMAAGPLLGDHLMAADCQLL